MGGSLEYIWQGLTTAMELLVRLDPETVSAVLATVKASSMSMGLSLLIGLPLGFALAQASFPGRRAARTTVDTLLSLPTVVIGLLAYAFISRRGPLGGLELLFTLQGVALAQTVLALPIVISLTASAVEGPGPATETDPPDPGSLGPPDGPLNPLGGPVRRPGRGPGRLRQGGLRGGHLDDGRG